PTSSTRRPSQGARCARSRSSRASSRRCSRRPSTTAGWRGRTSSGSALLLRLLQRALEDLAGGGFAGRGGGDGQVERKLALFLQLLLPRAGGLQIQLRDAGSRNREARILDQGLLLFLGRGGLRRGLGGVDGREGPGARQAHFELGRAVLLVQLQPA